uniref:Uncharacterized protein n=1 Tax=Rhizophora mucronata TaxID=61149 RepID=A0A2P2ISR3_RHIMU
MLSPFLPFSRSAKTSKFILRVSCYCMFPARDC